MKIPCLLLLSGVTFMSSLPLHAATTDAVTNDAALNGNFEQMKDGVPVGWSVPDLPELAKASFPTEKARGTFAQVQLFRSGDKGAYFSRQVTVEPHTRYRLALLARMDKGKITFAVTGGSGAKRLGVRLLGEPRTHLPMAPWFWDESWVSSLAFERNQWRPVTLEFDSGELTTVYISFGAYFTAGVYAFDNVTLTALPDTAPTTGQ